MTGPGVAFLSHPYHRGGVTRWMIDAAAEWSRRGRDVWFVTPRPAKPFRSGAGRPTMVSLLERLPPDQRPTIVAERVDWRFEYGTAAYRAASYSAALSAAVPPGTPVIVSDDAPAWWAVAMARPSYPLIGVLHSDDGAHYAQAARYAPAAGALVSVSRRIAHRLNSLLTSYTPATAVIPCGVPIAEPAGTFEPHRSRLRIVFVGRIEERSKRVSDLPRIAAALRAESFEFDLEIIGDGPERELLAGAIADAGLTGVTKLRGWMEASDIQAALGTADVLIITSNFEGMPIAAMEALRAGCAVISSRVSGIEDFEIHPSNQGSIRVFEIGDVDGATRCILSAAAEPSSMRRAAARSLAEAEFSIGRCIDRYEALIRSLPASGATNDARIRAPFLSGVSLPIAAARLLRVRLAARRNGIHAAD